MKITTIEQDIEKAKSIINEQNKFIPNYGVLDKIEPFTTHNIKGLLNKFNLNSKVIKREKNYMVYIKEAEKISDFLRIINSYNGVMYFEDIRIYRDHKNMSNRLNNCEQANIDKIFQTAARQLKDIEVLKENDVLDILDEKLLEVIKYRELYPESSLQELSEIMSNELGYEITKSGLNHRFRKIKEIASRLIEEIK